MDISEITDWPTDAKAAIALQRKLAPQVITADQLGEVKTVAGVDVGFEEGGAITRAAVVVLTFPELELLETAIARNPTTFPYVPGLLSFREAPTVLDALRQIRTEPDLILSDGQGIAHPRRLGIASHIGLLVDKPTIGVAKSRLVGTASEELLEEKGNWVPLMDKGERIGAMLRSRTGKNPLFISTGHRVSLETAIDYVLRCTPKYRLPETTRLADRLASRKGPMPPAKLDAGSQEFKGQAPATLDDEQMSLF